MMTATGKIVSAVHAIRAHAFPAPARKAAIPINTTAPSVGHRRRIMNSNCGDGRSRGADSSRLSGHPSKKSQGGVSPYNPENHQRDPQRYNANSDPLGHRQHPRRHGLHLYRPMLLLLHLTFVGNEPSSTSSTSADFAGGFTVARWPRQRWPVSPPQPRLRRPVSTGPDRPRRLPCRPCLPLPIDCRPAPAPGPRDSVRRTRTLPHRRAQAHAPGPQGADWTPFCDRDSEAAALWCPTTASNSDGFGAEP
jgi:hypothetical protein